MNPTAGVSLELLALAASLSLASLVPAGIPMALYLVVVGFLATYLIHCPAHYAAGRTVRIKFRTMKLGRTTLARSLPPTFSSLAKGLTVPTLIVDRRSLNGISPSRIAFMYASGTLASVASAITIAAAATPSVPWPYIIPSWAFALGYLGFDLVFSPRTGDLRRAKASLAAPRTYSEPVHH